MMFVLSAIFLLAASSTIDHVNAHGYLESPRSRNYVAKRDGKWSGGDNSTPRPETCPHCLNGGGERTSGQCGKTGNTNYDFPPNAIGGVMPKNIQATYVKGQEVDIGIEITAHHKGHFEFFLCPIEYGEVPTRDCFWSNPLEFVEDLKYGAQKDNNYPYRAYIPPSTFGELNYRYRMKLPDNVTGDLVLLQWWWVSANSCEAPGYNKYNFPAEWGSMGRLSQCNVLADGTITGAEQFWNCAEVQIIDSGSPPTPTTPLPPTGTSTDFPTFSPTIPRPDTLSPTQTPTISSPDTLSPTSTPIYGNYCGISWNDAGKCGIPCPTGNSTVCGSSEHCYADIACASVTKSPFSLPTSPPVQSSTNSPVSTPVALPTSPPVQSPTKSPVQEAGTCGGGNRGNGICSNPIHCCSEWGYCGSGETWCRFSNGQRFLRKQA